MYVDLSELMECLFTVVHFAVPAEVDDSVLAVAYLFSATSCNVTSM